MLNSVWKYHTSNQEWEKHFFFREAVAEVHKKSQVREIAHGDQHSCSEGWQRKSSNWRRDNLQQWVRRPRIMWPYAFSCTLLEDMDKEIKYSQVLLALLAIKLESLWIIQHCKRWAFLLLIISKNLRGSRSWPWERGGKILWRHVVCFFQRRHFSLHQSLTFLYTFLYTFLP